MKYTRLDYHREQIAKKMGLTLDEYKNKMRSVGMLSSSQIS